MFLRAAMKRYAKAQSIALWRPQLAASFLSNQVYDLTIDVLGGATVPGIWCHRVVRRI